MVDLAKLRKRSTDISKLVNAAKTASGEKNGPDERFWKPTVDKNGNGYAVIRFLPSPDEDVDGVNIPWVRYWDHGFKGPTGKWFIEKSLTSIGQTCPVSEMNSKLWAEGTEYSKKLASARKRRLHNISNILVISDPGNKDNEGKVFLFNYGKKIFDFISVAMDPEFPDEVPFVPFDLWEGADFVLKIRNVGDFRNYDKSEFKTPSALYDGDEEKLEALVKQLYSLKEFVDPSTYKTYDQLKAKLADVLGEVIPSTTKQESMESAPAPQPRSEEPKQQAPVSEPEEDAGDDDDDVMGYFEKLAQNN